MNILIILFNMRTYTLDVLVISFGIQVRSYAERQHVENQADRVQQTPSLVATGCDLFLHGETTQAQDNSGGSA